MTETTQDQLLTKEGSQTERISTPEAAVLSRPLDASVDDGFAQVSYRGVERRRNRDRRKKSRREVDRERTKAARPPKDNWDKIAALAPIISGTMIFVMGGWFTYTFNQQQLRLQEVQTIEKFIPHLMGNEQSKKAAILAISAMTNPELAGKFANIFASTGTVSALQKIATTGTEQEKTAANKALSDALEALAAQQSKLTDVESSYKQAIASQGSSGDVDQDDLAYKMSKLAQLYVMKGQYSLAEPLYKKVLALREKQYGANSPMAAEVLKGMAEMYEASGQTVKAEDCLKQARDIESKAQPTSNGPTKSPAPAPSDAVSPQTNTESTPAKESEAHPTSVAPTESKPRASLPQPDSKTHQALHPEFRPHIPQVQSSEPNHSLSQSSTAGDASHPVSERESESE
ncbi:MAG TPA: tetratricopeptide repeat protein [Planktothrix sp.]|jgi:tetratricopeptide (TPR) repeat protein